LRTLDYAILYLWILIKGGASSKEIAETLHLSVATIQKHRERIRHKLDLANKNINLASFLKNPEI
jgi:DNA-binding CsgD family transcriptional regulator